VATQFSRVDFSDYQDTRDNSSYYIMGNVKSVGRPEARNLLPGTFSGMPWIVPMEVYESPSF